MKISPREIKWISLALQILVLMAAMFVLTMFISRSLPLAVDEIVRVIIGIWMIYVATTGSVWFRAQAERLMLAIYERSNQ